MKAYASSTPQAGVIYGQLPGDFFDVMRSYNQLVSGMLGTMTGTQGAAQCLPGGRLPKGEARAMNAAISGIISTTVPFPGSYLADMHDAKLKRADAFEESDDFSAFRAQAELGALNDPMTYVTPELMDGCISILQSKELYGAAGLLAKRKGELFQ